MEMWVNLGIEKTKDIDAITAAYHEKLQLVHPEEKPDEFMALRQEYEDALSYAQQTDETEEKEKTPIDLWIEKVEAVYNDLPQRIDITKWQELLKDDVCQSLDSRIDARDALLRSTMQNSALPQNVWQLFEEVFSISENREALYEVFPKDYIDNCVISGTVNPPVVPYELFAEGTTGNPDCYFDLHYKARGEISKKDYDAAEATISDLEKCGFSHPYTDVLKARLLMCKDEYDKALELMNPLCDKYPEDIGIISQRGDILYCAERFEDALVDYEFVSSKGRNSIRYVLSQCYMKTGEYVKARDILIELVHDAPFENAFSTAFNEACAKVNEYYEQKFNDGTITVDETIDYAWACLQSDSLDKAKAITDPLSPDDIAQKCDLLNLRSKLYNNCRDYEMALKYADEWKDAINELPDGETAEEKKRKNKLDDIYYVKSHALRNLNRFDEAIEMAKLSIASGTSRQSEAHDLLRVIYRSEKKDYVAALHEAEAMAQVKPGSWSYFILGVEQYELGRLQDAFDSFGESLEYTLELECYIYRIRILCDVGQYDGAQSIVDFLDGHNIEADSLKYCKARILEGKDEDDEALKIYYAIIENIKNKNSDISIAHEVYYRAAEIERRKREKKPQEVLDLVNAGLEIRENYYDLLYIKTTLLEIMNKYKEAIEVYDKIEAEYPGRYRLNALYGDDYYNLHDYETSLKYYLKHLETTENAGVHDMAGLCLIYLYRFDEAVEHFNAAIELEPNSVRHLSNLGLTYEYAFDFDTAIKHHEKASALNDSLEEEDRKVYVNRALARALARAGRHDDAAAAYLKNLELFGRDDDARFVIEIYIEAKNLPKATEYINKFRAEEKITEEQYLMMTADVERLRGDYKSYFKYISKLPKDDTFRYSRMGRYYLHEGKYKKSLEFFDLYDAEEPNSLNMFNDRLVVYKKLGKNDEAEKVFKRALEVFDKREWDKDEYAIRLTKYALIYTAAGFPEKAKPFIDEALTVPLCEHCRYGKCKDAYIALAEYYEAIGEYDKAIETCREGLEIARDEYDFVYITERIRKEHKKELKKENQK